MNVHDSNSYKIRPAGRHLLTIGRELIQNSYAAVVELVKMHMTQTQQMLIFSSQLEPIYLDIQLQ